jgi:hypothetical protein
MGELRLHGERPPVGTDVACRITVQEIQRHRVRVLVEIVRPDGTLSPVHAESTVDGFEYNFKKTLLFAYYGGTFIRRDFAVDTSGKKPVLVGYGYPGSSNAQNRAIHEPTFGWIQTFWRDPKYGSLSLITQYSYLVRYPWNLATGAPKDAHASMVWVDLRYTLPGSAPTALPALPLKTQ